MIVVDGRAVQPGVCDRCGGVIQRGARVELKPGMGWRGECCAVRKSKEVAR